MANRYDNSLVGDEEQAPFLQSFPILAPNSLEPRFSSEKLDKETKLTLM
jgi:hypothetical protein